MDSWKKLKITTSNGVIKSILKLNTEEIIDLYIKCAGDPIYTIETFFEIFDQRFNTIVPFKLFPFQKKIIESYVANRLNLTNKYRQAGISTITCAYLAWYISFRKNRVVAIVADKLETARDELMRDVVNFIDMLPPFLHPKISEPDKQTHKGFANGSEVKAFATKRFRGMTPTFLFWDETAHAEKGEDFWTAVWPSLATGGQCAFVSCVVKDTFVWTDNGLQQMSDIINFKEKKEYFTDDYNILGKDKKRNGSMLYNNGIHKTKLLKTKYTDVEGTITHKLFSYLNGAGTIGYNKIGSIIKGDLIGIQYGLKVSGKNRIVKNVTATITNKKMYNIELNDNLLKFISYYILKGNKNFNGIPRIFINDINKNEFKTLKNILIKELNIKEELFTYENNNLEIKSVKVNSLLVNIGIDKIYKTKKLSKFLLGLDYDLLLSLTKNIFNINKSLELESTSKILLKQLQQILINIGYLSEIIDNSLYVSELSFNNNFKLKINCNNFDEFINDKKMVYNYNIPIGFIYNINKNLPEEFKLNLKYYTYTEIKEIISSNQVYNILSEYFNDSIFYDRITYSKYYHNETYDFSLPNNDEDKYCHSIIYNGIIGHQTPNGLDPVFYKTYAAAKNGKSKFNINEIYWYEDPRYNKKLKWVKKVSTENPEDPEETRDVLIFDEDQANFKRYLKDGYDPTSPWFEDMCMEYKFDKHKINQELRGDFLGSGNNFIDNSDIQYYERVHRCDPIRTEFDDNTWIWEEPVPNAKYVMNIDVSSGTSEDFSSIEILKQDGNILEQVLEFQGKISPDILGDLANRYGLRYNNAYAVIDITGGIGVSTVQRMLELGYKNIHYSLLRNEKIKERLISYAKTINDKTYLPGFTIGTNRGMILIEMKRVIEMREIIIKSSRLLSEFKTFVSVPNNVRIADHRRSFHDDLIMALGIGIYVISYELGSEQNDKEQLENMLKAMQALNAIDTENDTNYFNNNNNQTNEFVNPNAYLWLFNNLGNQKK